MGNMSLLLTLILLAPDSAAPKTAEVERYLKAGDTGKAVLVLREIGTLKGNHDEAKAIVKLVRNGRIQKPSEVTEACFLALKGIGSRKVTKQLLFLLKLKPLKKDPAVRIGICRALEGSTDPAGVETVLDLLRDRDDTVIAAAADAAGAYRYAKESVRKDLFKTIMGIYVSTWNLKNSVDPELKVQKRRAEDKWEIVEKPMERALQLLSNTTPNDPPAWRRWWNKNKKKKWEELEN